MFLTVKVSCYFTADSIVPLHWRSRDSSRLLSEQIWASKPALKPTTANGCVPIQGLHPLKANYVTTPREGCPKSRLLQTLLLFPVSGGCTATILGSLTYPKILWVPEKEDRKKRKKENGKERGREHLVRQPGNAPKARQSHLTTADASFKGLSFEDRKGRVLRRTQTWIGTQPMGDGVDVSHPLFYRLSSEPLTHQPLDDWHTMQPMRFQTQ